MSPKSTKNADESDKKIVFSSRKRVHLLLQKTFSKK
jgi:hypothetical protein